MTFQTFRSMLLLFAGLLAAKSTLAQSTMHEIAYQGYLDLDGGPQSGEFDFIFELYSSATDGECTTPTLECLWSDEFVAIGVWAGKFSLLLGSNQPLVDSVWQQDTVYLGIKVRRTTDINYTQLTGRQRIAAVPYAARAETAKNYRVTGTLEVDGPIVSRGIAPRYQAWGSQGVGDGGAGIYNDAASYQALMLVGNNSAGGVRKVRLYDDVTINGALATGSTTVTGNLVADGNSWGTCAWSASFSEEGAGHAYCPTGQYVAGVQCLSGAYCDNLRIYCCQL